MLALTSTPCCKHCGLAAPVGADFCCAGCESVYALLVERGLSHFYELRDQYTFAKPSPAALAATAASANWDELTDRDQAQFYIEGIHCLGCLWLLEKLPSIDSRILTSNLDLRHQLLQIQRKPGASLSWAEVTRLILQLGYSAKPVNEDNEGALRRADLRRQLARIGVAAFCAGNIMLLSISVYAGAEPAWATHFGWLSFLLAIPVLTYSAAPLYKTAFLPLLRGRLSVDLAIALAVLAGAALSLWTLLTGHQSTVYFDSITALVFLLLSSRFFLNRFRESLSRESAFLSFLSSERYQRLNNPALVAPEKIMAGDELEIAAGQTLPVDAVLESAAAHFDLSLLTGESAPVKALRGDRVEAGAKVLGVAAQVRAQLPASESRLARILDQIRAFQLRRSPSLEFADRVGRYFVVVVLSLSAGLLYLFPNEEGVRRALALTIVTCPCVLAFAVPLALTRAMQFAARRGILFAAPEKIEELAAVRSFFLDKTGTLTNGHFEVQAWEPIAGSAEEALAATNALEARSGHPVGKALARFTTATAAGAATEIEEIPGYGVKGKFRGGEWILGRAEAEASGANVVELRRNGELRARARLGDAVRPEAARVVKELRTLGGSVQVLSGDRESRVASLAKELSLDGWQAGLLPEDKARAVASVPHSAMVGDGANDAVAFRGAAVGIAVQGAVDLSLKNSDVVLTKPGLAGLTEAVRLARHTMRIVRGNFAVSLGYNVLAGVLAITGHMEPLWAALIMPLSALSVFTLTQWRSGGME